MFIRWQTRSSKLIVMAALAALLTAADLLGTASRMPVSAQPTKTVEVVVRTIEPNPRVRFAPLDGFKRPAPLANLEAPLSGRRPPAPLANLEAPLGGRKPPAPLANLEAPLGGRKPPAPLADRGTLPQASKVPGSALYMLGIASVALIGALRERLKKD